jgi:uncharacterized protein involved in tolerance to divalent cations
MTLKTYYIWYGTLLEEKEYFVFSKHYYYLPSKLIKF